VPKITAAAARLARRGSLVGSHNFYDKITSVGLQNFNDIRAIISGRFLYGGIDLEVEQLNFDLDF